MTSLQANASPLRQRMIDDMRMRQLSPETQDISLRIVREFARFLGRSLTRPPSRTCGVTSCISSITVHRLCH